MKYNKSNIVAFALGALMACGSIASAQSTNSSSTPASTNSVTGQRPARGGGLQQAAEKLGLTDEQKQKFTAAYRDQTKKRSALREDTSLSPDERKAKVKELVEETDAKVKTILTPDQYTKWQDMRKDMRPRASGSGDSSSTPTK